MLVHLWRNEIGTWCELGMIEDRVKDVGMLNAKHIAAWDISDTTCLDCLGRCVAHGKQASDRCREIAEIFRKLAKES